MPRERAPTTRQAKHALVAPSPHDSEKGVNRRRQLGFMKYGVIDKKQQNNPLGSREHARQLAMVFSQDASTSFSFDQPRTKQAFDADFGSAFGDMMSSGSSSTSSSSNSVLDEQDFFAAMHSFSGPSGTSRKNNSHFGRTEPTGANASSLTRDFSTSQQKATRHISTPPAPVVRSIQEERNRRLKEKLQSTPKTETPNQSSFPIQSNATTMKRSNATHNNRHIAGMPSSSALNDVSSDFSVPFFPENGELATSLGTRQNFQTDRVSPKQMVMVTKTPNRGKASFATSEPLSPAFSGTSSVGSGPAARRRVRQQMKAHKSTMHQSSTTQESFTTPPHSPQHPYQNGRPNINTSTSKTPIEYSSGSIRSGGVNSKARTTDHVANYQRSSTGANPSIYNVQQSQHSGFNTSGHSSAGLNVSGYSSTNRSVGSNSAGTSTELNIFDPRSTQGFTFDAFGLDASTMNEQVDKAINDIAGKYPSLNLFEESDSGWKWDENSTTSTSASRSSTPVQSVEDGFVDGFRVSRPTKLPVQHAIVRQSPTRSEKSTLTNDSYNNSAHNTSNGPGSSSQNNVNPFKVQAGFHSSKSNNRKVVRPDDTTTATTATTTYDDDNEHPTPSGQQNYHQTTSSSNLPALPTIPPLLAPPPEWTRSEQDEIVEVVDEPYENSLHNYNLNHRDIRIERTVERPSTYDAGRAQSDAGGRTHSDTGTNSTYQYGSDIAVNSDIVSNILRGSIEKESNMLAPDVPLEVRRGKKNNLLNVDSNQRSYGNNHVPNANVEYTPTTTAQDFEKKYADNNPKGEDETLKVENLRSRWEQKARTGPSLTGSARKIDDARIQPKAISKDYITNFEAKLGAELWSPEKIEKVSAEYIDNDEASTHDDINNNNNRVYNENNDSKWNVQSSQKNTNEVAPRTMEHKNISPHRNYNAQKTHEYPRGKQEHNLRQHESENIDILKPDRKLERETQLYEKRLDASISKSEGGNNVRYSNVNAILSKISKISEQPREALSDSGRELTTASATAALFNVNLRKSTQETEITKSVEVTKKEPKLSNESHKPVGSQNVMSQAMRMAMRGKDGMQRSEEISPRNRRTIALNRTENDDSKWLRQQNPNDDSSSAKPWNSPRQTRLLEKNAASSSNSNFDNTSGHESPTKKTEYEQSSPRNLNDYTNGSPIRIMKEESPTKSVTAQPKTLTYRERRELEIQKQRDLQRQTSVELSTSSMDVATLIKRRIAANKEKIVTPPPPQKSEDSSFASTMRLKLKPVAKPERMDMKNDFSVSSSSSHGHFLDSQTTEFCEDNKNEASVSDSVSYATEGKASNDEGSLDRHDGHIYNRSNNWQEQDHKSLNRGSSQTPVKNNQFARDTNRSREDDREREGIHARYDERQEKVASVLYNQNQINQSERQKMQIYSGHEHDETVYHDDSATSITNDSLEDLVRSEQRTVNPPSVSVLQGPSDLIYTDDRSAANTVPPKPKAQNPTISHLLMLQSLQQRSQCESVPPSPSKEKSRSSRNLTIDASDNDDRMTPKGSTPKATMMMLNAFLAGRESLSTANAGVATSKHKATDSSNEVEASEKQNSNKGTSTFRAIKDDPEYARFFKMLAVGMPMEVVKHAMTREGIDPSIMDGDHSKPAGIPLKDDPDYSKYFRMLNIGLPMEAVKHSMARDGLDPNVMDQDHSLPVKSNKKQEDLPKESDSHRRARLHWKTLRKVASNSLWAKLDQEVDLEGIEIDEQEFQELFQEEKSAVPKSASKTANQKKGSTVCVIDSKRANNGGIILARLKMSHDDLADAVDHIDERPLSAELIENIIEYLPTKDERRALEAYMLEGGQDAAEKFDCLCECEKFMVSMMTVKHAKRKLSALLFKLQFETCLHDIHKEAHLVETACEELSSSVRLRQLLGIVLTFGNRLNTAGNGQGKAGAFTLDSLLKLKQAKAFDKKTTFLHYIVLIVRRNSELLLNFKDDLPTVFAAEKVFWDQCVADLNEVENQLENLRKISLYQAHQNQAYRLRHKKKSTHTQDQDESLSDAELVLTLEEEVEALRATPIGLFTLNAIRLVSALSSKVENTNIMYNQLLEYFGEEDNKKQPHELFSIITSFSREFEKAKDEVITNEKKKVREERRTQSQGRPPTHQSPLPQSQNSASKSKSTLLRASNHQPNLSAVINDLRSTMGMKSKKSEENQMPPRHESYHTSRDHEMQNTSSQEAGLNTMEIEPSRKYDSNVASKALSELYINDEQQLPRKVEKGRSSNSGDVSNVSASETDERIHNSENNTQLVDSLAKLNYGNSKDETSNSVLNTSAGNDDSSVTGSEGQSMSSMRAKARLRRQRYSGSFGALSHRPQTTTPVTRPTLPAQETLPLNDTKMKVGADNNVHTSTNGIDAASTVTQRKNQSYNSSAASRFSPPPRTMQILSPGTPPVERSDPNLNSGSTPNFKHNTTQPSLGTTNSTLFSSAASRAAIRNRRRLVEQQQRATQTKDNNSNTIQL